MDSPLDHLFGARRDEAIDQLWAQLVSCDGDHACKLALRGEVMNVFVDAFKLILNYDIKTADTFHTLVKRISDAYRCAARKHLLAEPPGTKEIIDIGMAMMLLNEPDDFDVFFGRCTEVTRLIYNGIFSDGPWPTDWHRLFVAAWCDPASKVYINVPSLVARLQVARRNHTIIPIYSDELPSDLFDAGARAAIHRMHNDFTAVCAIMFNNRVPATVDELRLYCWVEFNASRYSDVIDELVTALGGDVLVRVARESIMAGTMGPRTYDVFQYIALRCGKLKLKDQLRLFCLGEPIVPFLRIVLEASDVKVLLAHHRLGQDLASMVNSGDLSADDIICDGGHVLHLLASTCLRPDQGKALVDAAINVLMSKQQ